MSPAIVKNGGFALADLQGELILSCNPDTSYIPASIMKIATALAALHILGPGFCFPTELYMDGDADLYIKGYGDPMLISEEVDKILHALIAKGIKRINGIFIDQSAFALEHDIPGRSSSNNPYDAPLAALAVNFNTVFLQITPNGTVVSAEPQTPLLPLMITLGNGYQPGRYRFNIHTGRIAIDEQASRYAVELFRSLQRRLSIPGAGMTGIAHVPRTATLIYKHCNSRTLSEVLAACLKYSNNFIANQVYLACGAQLFGYPATWEKARRAVNSMIDHLLAAGHGPDMSQVEGSGLSRRNKMTPRTMIRLLHLFTPYMELLPVIAGIRAKSGTMDGIYSYAGYLANGRPFVVMLNQPGNTRDLVLRWLRGRQGVADRVRQTK